MPHWLCEFEHRYDWKTQWVHIQHRYFVLSHASIMAFTYERFNPLFSQFHFSHLTATMAGRRMLPSKVLDHTLFILFKLATSLTRSRSQWSIIPRLQELFSKEGYTKRYISTNILSPPTKKIKKCILYWLLKSMEVQHVIWAALNRNWETIAKQLYNGKYLHFPVAMEVKSPTS